MIKTTYLKKNGEIVDRITYLRSGYKIGETNGNGWKVLDIKYKYNDCFYSFNEYNDILNKEWEKDKKKIQFTRNIKTIYKNINHILEFLILFKLLDIVLDIVI